MGRFGGGHGRVELQQPLLPQTKKELEPNRKRGLVALLLLDPVFVVVVYFWMNNWSTDNLFPSSYNFKECPLDIVVLVLVRSLLTGVGLAWRFTMAFWVCFAGFILHLGKAIVWDYSLPPRGTALVLGSLAISLIELWLIYNMEREVKVEEQEMGNDIESRDRASGVANNGPVKSFGIRSFAKVLRPYFWPHGCKNRFRVFMTWAMLVGSKACNIMTPLFLGSAATALQMKTEVPYGWIQLYCLFAFCSVFFKQCQNVIYLGVKQTAYAELSEYTFRHLHMLSLEWHLQKKMGNVLRAMDRGVNSADTVVTYLFLYVGPSLVECGVVFVVFFAHFKQPELAMIAFYAVTLYIVATVQITQWRKKFRSAQNKHDNELHDKATDSLINYETVKYFANEEYEIDRYCQSVRQYQRFNVSTQMSLGFLNATQQLIIQLSMLGVLSVAAYKTYHDEMTLGNFVATNAYLLQLYTPLNFLGSIYNAIIQAMIDMKNLGELLAVEPDVIDKPNAPALQLPNANIGVELGFNNVWFQYPSDRGTSRYTLKGISFQVAPGTTTAVVGHTGAGKSTLARLLFRFYDVSKGSVSVGGQVVEDVQQQSVRRMIGVVPQDTVMFNDSIRANVAYGRLGASQEEIDEACRAAQILDFIQSLPEGWDTKVGERGLKLSGGEKQRVAIARALLKNPPVVLLDEATSALDSVTEKSIQTALQTLGQHRTTLIIAHRLSTIKHAQQIVVLNAGEVAERGTHEQLLAKGGIYAEMWTLQKREQAHASTEEREPNLFADETKEAA